MQDGLQNKPAQLEPPIGIVKDRLGATNQLFAKEGAGGLVWALEAGESVLNYSAGLS